jgi:hypothetical protein
MTAARIMENLGRLGIVTAMVLVLGLVGWIETLGQ